MGAAAMLWTGRTGNMPVKMAPGAGFTEPHLTATAYALSNHVIGAALMQTSWQTHDEQQARRTAQEHLHAERDKYPTLAAHGPFVGDDWDETYALGLAYLLDGIQTHRSTQA